MEIRTPEDWWRGVLAYWDDILVIAGNCVDLNKPNPHTLRTDPLLVDFVNAKRERNHEVLHALFQMVWAAAPDAPYIHRWRGWGVLCDLCSEFWVFIPEEYQDAVENMGSTTEEAKESGASETDDGGRKN